MEKTPPPIEDLWKEVGITPNLEQENAIKHVESPLFLAAGPDSGKTRVLLCLLNNIKSIPAIKIPKRFSHLFE
jgi:hypothetical protein